MSEWSADVRYRALDSATRSSTEMERPCNGDGIGSRNEYMNLGELKYLDANANDDGQLRFRELQKFHRGG